MDRPLTFNGPVETGLRSLAVLTAVHPRKLDMAKLVVFDYLVVHSDDFPGGPPGLHPKTPYRSGELLIRREVIRYGLSLYRSRGLIERTFDSSGVSYSATEHAGGFLDALDATYAQQLRVKAQWIATELRSFSGEALSLLVNKNLGAWGAEFEYESVLFQEEAP